MKFEPITPADMGAIKPPRNRMSSEDARLFAHRLASMPVGSSLAYVEEPRDTATGLAQLVIMRIRTLQKNRSLPPGTWTVNQTADPQRVVITRNPAMGKVKPLQAQPKPAAPAPQIKSGLGSIDPAKPPLMPFFKP